MSREIKFRGWLKSRWEGDEDANKMYYDIQNSYDTLGDVKPYDPMTDFKEWIDDDIAVVEQYTGLKDKNDKEIYEGDIVKQLMYVLEGKECITTWVVRWNNNEFCYDLHRVSGALYGDSMMSSGDAKDYEVIGNIHENPELLEEGK